MKSKDLEKLVLSKHGNGDSTSKTFHDVNGSVGYRTIQRWCQMIREHSSIDLYRPPCCSRIIRTKNMIQKVKSRLQRKKRVSIRKLISELSISNTLIHQILTKDLGYCTYKKRIEHAIIIEKAL
jgi:Ni,Fe-hydrogenase III large subunit